MKNNKSRFKSGFKKIVKNIQDTPLLYVVPLALLGILNVTQVAVAVTIWPVHLVLAILVFLTVVVWVIGRFRK